MKLEGKGNLYLRLTLLMRRSNNKPFKLFINWLRYRGFFDEVWPKEERKKKQEDYRQAIKKIREEK